MSTEEKWSSRFLSQNTNQSLDLVFKCTMDQLKRMGWRIFSCKTLYQCRSGGRTVEYKSCIVIKWSAAGVIGSRLLLQKPPPVVRISRPSQLQIGKNNQIKRSQSILFPPRISTKCQRPDMFDFYTRGRLWCFYSESKFSWTQWPIQTSWRLEWFQEVQNQKSSSLEFSSSAFCWNGGQMLANQGGAGGTNSACPSHSWSSHWTDNSTRGGCGSALDSATGACRSNQDLI